MPDYSAFTAWLALVPGIAFPVRGGDRDRMPAWWACAAARHAARNPIFLRIALWCFSGSRYLQALRENRR